MHEAWRMFCKMKDWQDSFPHLMKLWQATLVIPSSTVSCERGFSKQNLIKEMKRYSDCIMTQNQICGTIIQTVK